MSPVSLGLSGGGREGGRGDKGDYCPAAEHVNWSGVGVGAVGQTGRRRRERSCSGT